MFRISVITDEISQDFCQAVELSARFGLDAVELRSVYDRDPFELTQEDIVRIRRELEGTGLEVCCIAAPFFKCDIDSPAEQEAHLDGLRRCIEIAKELGAGLIRGFAFWDKGDFAERTGQIARLYQKPAELAREAGIILVLESDPSVYTTNAAKLVQAVEAINHPSVKALWDPGNDIYDPDGECPYPDGYERIRPLMAHMHLKDARIRDGKPEGAPVGQGDVDWRGQLARLLKDGYEGYLSLETHYRPSHTLSEEILALPKGEAFSYLGYEATEESLGYWRQMLEEAGWKPRRGMPWQKGDDL